MVVVVAAPVVAVEPVVVAEAEADVPAGAETLAGAASISGEASASLDVSPEASLPVTATVSTPVAKATPLKLPPLVATSAVSACVPPVPATTEVPSDVVVDTCDARESRLRQEPPDPASERDAEGGDDDDWTAVPDWPSVSVSSKLTYVTYSCL